MSFSELSANEARVMLDYRQTYQAYLAAREGERAFAGGMFWKTVNGAEYLVRSSNSRGGNKSLGRRSAETEQIFADYHSGKARSKARVAALKDTVREFAGMSVGLGLNRVPKVVAAILRRMDEFGLLGKNLQVIGTHALYGYEAVAGVRFDAGLMATTDIDFMWDASSRLKLVQLDAEVRQAGVLAVLKKVDASFEAVRSEGFRAVNQQGFYVDLVRPTPSPPWKSGVPDKLSAQDMQPADIPNLKWLLSSQKFNAMVIGQDGLPAPMVAPDPRAFALYKLWLSQQAERDPLKRKRDQLQGRAVAEMVIQKLPHLPFDAAAMQMFPLSVRAAADDF